MPFIGAVRVGGAPFLLWVSPIAVVVLGAVRQCRGLDDVECGSFKPGGRTLCNPQRVDSLTSPDQVRSLKVVLTLGLLPAGSGANARRDQIK